ncbi:MAG: branched-chain amino acid ABC transporter permease [Armatimonadota bacterium]|nr:branched-chain amino acid ABC transporter permease [Armatimonadota bacterium]
MIRGLAALGLLAALAVPILGTRDLVTATFFTWLYIVLALNCDLLGGFLGYMTLGQGAFFGLAAYLAVLLLNSGRLDALGPADAPVAVAASVAAAATVAAGFAYPLFRLSGAYFAMATFAMVLLIRHLILNLPDLTGGSYGVYVHPRHFLSLHLAYVLALVLLAGSLALNRALARSRLGLAVAAIRDSEPAAAAIGLDLFRVKRRVLVLSAVPSALAGGVFALQAGYIDVDAALGADKTLLPVIMALMGGSGHPAGPLVGGLLVRALDVVLKNYLRLTVPALAVYGLLLLAIGLLRPQGVLHVRRRRPQPA